MIGKINFLGLLATQFLAVPFATSLGSGNIKKATEPEQIHPIAHYKFEVSSNLGKDSMGNHDLITYGEGLTQGTDDGYYLNFGAGSALHSLTTGNADFVDSLTDYTLSFDLKKDKGAQDWNAFLNSGYGSGGGLGITVYCAGAGIDVKISGVDNVYPTDALDGTKFDNVTLRYDSSATKLAVFINGTLIEEKTGINGSLAFADFNFCIGGAWNNYQESILGAPLVANCSSGAIRNVRLFDSVLSNAYVSELAKGNPIYKTSYGVQFANDVHSHITDVKVNDVAQTGSLDVNEGDVVTFKVSADDKYVVESVKNNDVTLTADQDGVYTVTVSGTHVITVKSSRISQTALINPIAQYKFEDVTDLGKDSMGNYNLIAYGTGLTQGTDDGYYLNFGANSALHSETLAGGLDFVDSLTDYTLAFDVKKDKSAGDWSQFLSSGAMYGHTDGLSVFAAGTGLDVKSVGTDNVFSTAALDGTKFDSVVIQYVDSIGALSCYINGSLVETKTTSAKIAVKDYNFCLGGNWNNYQESISGTPLELCCSVGSIRNVRIFDRAVGESNVLDLMYGNSIYGESVESVSLNKTTLSLLEGTNETLVATIAPTTAYNKNVTWASNNESVATVDQTGKVSAVAPGTATITVTTEDEGKTASCEVTVTELRYAVTLTGDTHSTFIDIKVNGVETTGALSVKKNDVVSFKVDVTAHYEIDTIKANGSDIVADANGVYTLNPTGDVAVTCSTKATTYEIKYHTNTDDGLIRDYYTVESSSIVLKTVEKEGYTFVGWYETEDFSSAKVTSLLPSEGRNIDLYAKFEKNVYTVTYYFGEEVVGTEQVNHGDKITGAGISKEGYTLEGFYTDAEFTNAFDSNTEITADLTLYAKFVKIEQIKIGCGGSVLAPSMVVFVLSLAGVVMLSKKRED